MDLGFVCRAAALKARAAWQAACFFFSGCVKSRTVAFSATAKVVLSYIFENICMRCTRLVGSGAGGGGGCGYNIPARRMKLCLRPRPLLGEVPGPGLPGKDPAGPASASSPCHNIHSLDECVGERGRTVILAGTAFRRRRFNELRGFKRSWHQNQKPGGCRHVLLLDLTNTSSLPGAVDQPFPPYYKTRPCGLHSLLTAQINNLLENNIFGLVCCFFFFKELNGALNSTNEADSCYRGNR